MKKCKEFNTAGPCVPELHYMADTSCQIDQICKMVNDGKYFTINRARQFGKTTTLTLLERKLKDKYTVLRISFESFDSSIFENVPVFCNEFLITCADKMQKNDISESLIQKWLIGFNNISTAQLNFNELSRRMTMLCAKTEKPVVLMIDEVDKSSNNQLFLNFLGMLRNKYIERNASGEVTFQSVILAGVYDIKNIKLKLRPEEQATYNSPWNIAAPFTVDMSLSQVEISGMLSEYEADHHTEMDTAVISNEIYSYTSGYPFLVSAICKLIDERLNKEWTIDGIRKAVKIILIERNTLFDDIIKNLNRHEELYKMVYKILVNGSSKGYNAYNSAIDLGLTFGLFKLTSVESLTICISNRIFETMIYDYLISELDDDDEVNIEQYTQNNRFIIDGKLNMQLVLIKFQELMKAESRSRDDDFIEQNGRLLFLCFIKPIINGIGHYAVEPQTRENTRMDIDVFYGNDEFIIELKIWHGENMLKEAEQQLYGYLDSRSADKGYLICFSFNKDKKYLAENTTVNGKNIFEIIV